MLLSSVLGDAFSFLFFSAGYKPDKSSDMGGRGVGCLFIHSVIEITVSALIEQACFLSACPVCVFNSLLMTASGSLHLI